MAEQERVETIYQLVGDLGTAVAQVNNAIATIQQSLTQLVSTGVKVASDPDVAAILAAVNGLVTAQAAEKSEVDVIEADVTPPPTPTVGTPPPPAA